MDNMYYIVLYKDGTMMPVISRPLKENHQKGARFFECDRDITLEDIGEWYANGNPAENKQYNKPTIKEIEGK